MKTTCPECSERFDITPEMIGKKAKCGQCAHVFVVPEVVEKKTKKEQVDTNDTSDIRQSAWLSLYLAGMGVMLLLFRGHQSGMIATLLFALAIETAAVYLVWRGFISVWPLKDAEKEQHLIKTAILVNSILLGLLGLSVLLTLYAIIAGPSAGGMGGLGGLEQIMKGYKDALQNIK